MVHLFACGCNAPYNLGAKKCTKITGKKTLVGSEQQMEGLDRIANCDDPDRIGDVVFVHGLGGNSASTWHPNGEPDIFWPKWLGEDLTHVGVWSFRYDARKITWSKNKPTLLVDKATYALAVLQTAKIGERPLIFVTHSLGGLLVKQLLRHSRDLGNEKWEQLLDNTCGISFIATPHSGSDIANWVGYLKYVLGTTVTVAELEANDSRILELNKWYRNNVEKLAIATDAFQETIPTKIKGWRTVVIVDQSSSDPNVKGTTPIPIPGEDHISICKPKSRQSLVYVRTKQFVEGCLDSSNSGLSNEGVAGRIETGFRVVGVGSHPPSHRPLIRDIDRAIVNGDLKDSELGGEVLDLLCSEENLKLSKPYDPNPLIIGLRLGDDYFAKVETSPGIRYWQRDFAQITAPVLVGLTKVLERTPAAQAVVVRCCELITRRLRLRIAWPAGPDEVSDLRNKIYKACLEAHRLECDFVLIALQGIQVVGPE